MASRNISHEHNMGFPESTKAAIPSLFCDSMENDIWELLKKINYSFSNQILCFDHTPLKKKNDNNGSCSSI